LSDKTQNIRVVIMLLTVGLEAIFNEFVCKCMVCLHTKFHTPSTNSSVRIAIKPIAKCRFHATAILLLRILQKLVQTKGACFVNFRYQASFRDPTLSGTSIA
jgi:hypothetical protein